MASSEKPADQDQHCFQKKSMIMESAGQRIRNMKHLLPRAILVLQEKKCCFHTEFHILHHGCTKLPYSNQVHEK